MLTAPNYLLHFRPQCHGVTCQLGDFVRVGGVSVMYQPLLEVVQQRRTPSLFMRLDRGNETRGDTNI